MAMAEISHAALLSQHFAVIGWWWTRFLEHRTLEHRFGMSLFEVGRVCLASNLDWYWIHYLEIKDCFSSGLIFTIRHQTTMPVLQWAVKKCRELGNQKLILRNVFVNWCARNGYLQMLDLALHSTDVAEIDWTRDVVSEAILFGQVKVLEWWDQNQDALPPQNLDCSKHLFESARLDALDVLEWWCARGFPVAKSEWQQICVGAIGYNSRNTQIWLCDRVHLFLPDSDQSFFNDCTLALNWATAFTLDFFGTVFPDLPLAVPRKVYSRITALIWWCCRTNISITSLLPLDSRYLEGMLSSSNIVLLEWWLQAHLAASHRFVLPESDKLDEYFEDDRDTHQWVHDVTVTRGILVYVKETEETMPYTAPRIPFSD
ncbi:hypothetical protein BC828DRAFT_379375 [Blastocladiella britannica]|nr:hypothetical protein BC828DRAFT_379375 [Blastocladiella britannica]